VVDYKQVVVAVAMGNKPAFGDFLAVDNREILVVADLDLFKNNLIV
jgi:hypothetical protein